MAKKTVIRRHIKLVPLSVEIAQTVATEEFMQSGGSATALFLQEPEENTLEQGLAEFNQRLQDHNCAPDDPLLLKFLVKKAIDHQANADEVKVAAVADFDAFWEDFEAFKEGQGKGGDVKASKDPKITPMTIGIIREGCKDDLAGLLVREGVRSLEELSEKRGGEIVDILNQQGG